MDEYLENKNLVPLSQHELIKCEGGIILIMGLVFGGLALGLTAVYGVGYAVGSLTK